MSKNPFSRSNPQEPISGDQMSFFNERKVLQGTNAQGETYEIETGETVLRPDGNGGYETIKITKTDAHGYPLIDDPSSWTFSHTGRLTPLKESGECNSVFHPAGISKIVYIGRDGKRTESGVICSRCLAWHTLIKQFLAIIGIGVFAGLLMGIF